MILETCIPNPRSRKRLLWLLLLLVVLAVVGWFAYAWHQQQNKDPFVIALAGPMSGDYVSNGEAMERAVRLCIDETNAKGGIHGRKVELVVYDDKNNPQSSVTVARKISQSNALAVIGHHTSTNSLAASDTYKEYAVPAVTGSATADNLTTENDWYFRVIFSNSDQAALIANYVSKILGFQTAYILSVNDAFGAALAESFSKNAKQIGLTIGKHWQFEDNQDAFIATRNTLLKELKELLSKENAILFLATHSRESAYMLAALRGQKIAVIGPDSLSSQGFFEHIRNFPQERTHPGYYTDNVYTTSPFLGDIASQRANQFNLAYVNLYNEDPSVTTAMYYDSALVVLHAMKHVDPDADIENQRKQVREGLWDLSSPIRAIEGVTGQLYFDEHGNGIKPIPIGVFRNGKPVVATQQFQPIGDMSGIPNLLQEALDNQIIHVNKKFMRRAQVIYTGIEVNEVSELNIRDSTYTADFYLWFRHEKDFNFDDRNLDFANIRDPLLVSTEDFFEPIVKGQVSKVDSNLITKAYRIKSQFKVNFDFSKYPFDNQTLPIRFRHKQLTRDRLIYVVDTLGLNLSNASQKILQKFARNNVFNIDGWQLLAMDFFQNSKKTDSSLGLPELFDSEQRIEYSQFNIALNMRRDVNQFILKNLVPVMLLGVIGYFIFFIPMQANGVGFVVRSTLAINLIIATTLLHFRLDSSMPTVDYLVLIEYAFYGIYTLTVFAILISVFNQAQSHYNNHDCVSLAQKADSLGKFMYVLFLVAVVATIVYNY